MNYQKIIQEIKEEILSYPQEGEVANYIPELAKVNPHHFGIHLALLNGKSFSIGDSEQKFSIQSISKVLATVLAFSRLGEKIWERVGVEPSGNPFNSLIQLEYEKGIPRNPFINAGALVVTDILLSLIPTIKDDFLTFIRKLANEPSINYNFTVAASEKAHGFRNAALVNFLKAYQNIHNAPEEVLDLYFLFCSIEMSCRELASAFLFLANEGVSPSTHEQILNKSQTKRINALMQTCGFYDEAGEFTFKVGLPGKSGVGGGIVAVCPYQYAITVWSPPLNTKGNSVMGMRALELFTTKTGISIF